MFARLGYICIALPWHESVLISLLCSPAQSSLSEEFPMVLVHSQEEKGLAWTATIMFERDVNNYYTFGHLTLCWDPTHAS